MIGERTNKLTLHTIVQILLLIVIIIHHCLMIAHVVFVVLQFILVVKKKCRTQTKELNILQITNANYYCYY